MLILILLGLALLSVATAWNAGMLLVHLIPLSTHDPLSWVSMIGAGVALLGSLVGLVLLGIFIARKAWR